MRVSREAAAESKARVVAAASKMLRERGFEPSSIADVMHAAGMTHGGFYKHFGSKNDLVREAVRAAFADVIGRFDRRSAESGHAAALAAYLTEYLSPGHVVEPGVGCPVAALGADAGRQSDWLGPEFAAGAEALIERVAGSAKRSLAGEEPQVRAVAIRTLAQLVGAVVVARAVGGGPLRDEVLASCAEGVSLQSNEPSGREASSD